MDGYILTIEREVLAWPGVSLEPGRSGATSFRCGDRELGHIHRDRVADLPITQEVRDDLLSKGRARPHRARVKGYISYPVESPEDLSVVLEILGSNYDRAEEAARRRAAGRQTKEE